MRKFASHDRFTIGSFSRIEVNSHRENKWRQPNQHKAGSIGYAVAEMGRGDSQGSRNQNHGS